MPGLEIKPPIRVRSESYNCWLSSIKNCYGAPDGSGTRYEYALTFPTEERIYATVHDVPDCIALQETIAEYARMMEYGNGYRISDVENELTRGVAFLGDRITHRVEADGRWGRKITVRFGERLFEGMAWLPSSYHQLHVDSEMRKRRERPVYLGDPDLKRCLGVTVQALVGCAEYLDGDEFRDEEDMNMDLHVDALILKLRDGTGRDGSRMQITFRLDIDGQREVVMDGEIDRKTRKGRFVKRLEPFQSDKDYSQEET